MPEATEQRACVDQVIQMLQGDLSKFHLGATYNFIDAVDKAPSPTGSKANDEKGEVASHGCALPLSL